VNQRYAEVLGCGSYVHRFCSHYIASPLQAECGRPQPII
jgi:hypothetical protein